jgi:hypothetical protein
LESRHDKTLAFVRFPIVTAILFALSAAALSAEEPMLPQTLVPGAGFNTGGPRGFLKPSKSIKPPPSAPAAAAAPLAIVQTPTAETRLRRLIVVSGDMTPEAIREAIIACGQSRTPVTTAGGVSAPAPVLTDLAGLFGSTVTEDTQKKVLETVRKGMGTGTSSKPLKRAEVVGWVPSEGVMAVVVYPES